MFRPLCRFSMFFWCAYTIRVLCIGWMWIRWSCFSSFFFCNVFSICNLLPHIVCYYVLDEANIRLIFFMSRHFVKGNTSLLIFFRFYFFFSFSRTVHITHFCRYAINLYSQTSKRTLSTTWNVYCILLQVEKSHSHNKVFSVFIFRMIKPKKTTGKQLNKNI